MKAGSILNFPFEFLRWLLAGIPGRAGVFLRRFAYRPFMAEGSLFDLLERVEIHDLANLSLGDGTTIESGCTLYCMNAPLKIGKGCYLNRNVRLGSGGDAPLTMGDNVMVGPNVVMDTSRHNHDRLDLPMKEQGLSYEPIIVGDDVWVGANAVITCGVKVGRGSIVGAGAVVTRDVDEFSIVGGVPARKIGLRKEQN